MFFKTLSSYILISSSHLLNEINVKPLTSLPNNFSNLENNLN